MPSANPPTAHVANEAITAFGSCLQDQAICLTTLVPKLVPISNGSLVFRRAADDSTTPVPKLVPMSKVKLSPTLRTLIEVCEPRLQAPGLPC